jgi:hypothetical protein
MTKTVIAERPHPHPDRPDVLVQPLTGETPDYIKVCRRHEYAAPPVVHLADIGACPFCEAEWQALDSRLRYRELIAMIQGWPER